MGRKPIQVEIKYNLNSESGDYEVGKIHIPEMLNEHLIPIEITKEVDNKDYVSPELNENINSIFNGVFNSVGGDWSKNGIIHLEWKDINFGRVRCLCSRVFRPETFDVLYEVDNSIFTVPKSSRSYG